MMTKAKRFFSPEHREKLSKAAIERCKRAVSKETKRRRSEAQRRRCQRDPEHLKRLMNWGYNNTGENNGQWKGEAVTYKALHDYIKYHVPKTELCQECGIAPPYDLANISGKYLRDFKDWEWLCRRCHMIKDGRMIKNLRQYGKQKHTALST